MTDLERLQQLSGQMHLEAAEDAHPLVVDLPRSRPRREALAVSTAVLPNGGRIRLLKTLLSSYCENSCRYCPFQTQNDLPRTAFTPDEFARLFIQLHRAGFVEGIFLSSGVFQSPAATQDQLLDTAAILRRKFHYQGYLHLKIMPGATRAHVEEAMRLADRLSVNLEAPHSKALSALAPGKDFQQDLLQPLRWMEEIRRQQSAHLAWKAAWPSSTTQFVVGAVGETDLDLLARTVHLTRSTGITRAYFSSFNPIPGTSFQNRPPSPPLREFRLYQSSFLLRDYGFDLEELPFQQDGFLPLEQDPKQAWAEIHLKDNPLEVNTARRAALLRVPGLGPRRTAAILANRRLATIRSIPHLKAIGAFSPRALPYLLLDGRSLAQQLALW